LQGEIGKRRYGLTKTRNDKTSSVRRSVSMVLKETDGVSIMVKEERQKGGSGVVCLAGSPVKAK